MIQNRFRLSGNPLERLQGSREPRKIFWLSVEGTVTEHDYFRGLSKYRERAGIPALIEVEALGRVRNKGDSSIEDVRELMDEFLHTRSTSIKELILQIEPTFFDVYPVHVLQDYLNDGLSVSNRNKFVDTLQRIGINIRYLKYLKERSSEEDGFCVVIDRDQYSHTIEGILQCKKWCEEHSVHFFLSNPCFEFWLLLHFRDISVDYNADEKAMMLKNHKISNKHTYIGKELSTAIEMLTGRGQHKGIRQFEILYGPRIDQAVERSIKFASTFPELFSELGTSIPALLQLLRSQQ